MSSPISGFSGFNSGLPIDDIVAQLIAVERRPIDLIRQRQNVIKQQQSAYSAVQTRVSDLLGSIKQLTKRNVDGTSIFEKMAASTSDDKIATASVTTSAAAQQITLEVKSLPSSTKASSLQGVGRYDAATELYTMGITSGSFSVYVKDNNTNTTTLHTITVDGTQGVDTLGSVMADIQATVPEITGASIVDGKIVFTHSGAPDIDIMLGAGGDTTNFLAKTYLNTAIDDGNGTLSASQRSTTINLTAAVSDAAANIATPVTDGTFTINGVSFDTTGKSLNEIISEINNSAAKVTAKFNTGNNSFELVAKDTGSAFISMADGTGNFLTAMGLISGGGNSTDSQTIGKNTEFVLNGVTMYATSTTVDETVTGLTGVTLNLKQSQPGTEVQINIQNDKDNLKTAITDVIAKYNAAISFIDQQTNAEAGGILTGDNRLKALRSQIRGLFTEQVAGLAGSSYDSLQQVGISTGAVGSTAGSATSQLQLDESKLEAALADNLATVKKLFIAQDLGGVLDGTANDDNMDGTFTRIFHLLADTTYTTGSGATSYGALYNGGDLQRGLFPAYQSSAQKRISDLDKAIQRQEDRLAKREKTLKQQFLAMDKMVGQYMSQSNALNGLISQLSANSGQQQ